MLNITNDWKYVISICLDSEWNDHITETSRDKVKVKSWNIGFAELVFVNILTAFQVIYRNQSTNKKK